jgi:glutathione S-transferase
LQALLQEAPMLRILGRKTSINVRKVLWTAAEIGAQFQHEAEWADSSSLRSVEFLRLNPNGLVPVIVDEAGVLWESNTICRYLAAKHRRFDLLPTDPFMRAEIEKWMDWQATNLNTAWRHAFMALVRRDPAFTDQAAIERSIERWNQEMLLLEDRLEQTGSYVAGTGFTLADVVLGLSVQRWKLTPMDRPATPMIDAYSDRLKVRPAVITWMSPDIP